MVLKLMEDFIDISSVPIKYTKSFRFEKTLRNGFRYLRVVNSYDIAYSAFF